MIAKKLIVAAQTLSSQVGKLKFAAPVTHVYNPLDYAWEPHQIYLERYANSSKRIIFLGMNPGPYGMAQCGIPFGELTAVRDWLGIHGKVTKPLEENPKKAVEGFSCTRSEVSGKRLWGLFQERFVLPEKFFAEHFVANYCPLAFFDEGRNLTPDKLPAAEVAPLYAACDEHLREMVGATDAQWVIGVGAFAEERARIALAGKNVKIGRILHPSPASPAANRGWSAAATKQLADLGLWNTDLLR